MRSVEGDSTSQTQSGATVRYAASDQSAHVRCASPQGPERDIGAEVQLGFIENQPAAGTVDAELKRTGNQGAERRGGANVPEDRLRRCVKLAAENLGHEILGDSAKICVGCVFL